MQLDNKNSLKSPEVYSCVTCDYTTVSSRDYNKHLLTAKHKVRSLDDSLDDKKLLKFLQFYCDKCQYTCSNKGDYIKHCNTIKHNAGSNINDEIHTTNNYSCLCGNIYKYRQGLSKHRKICKILNETTESIQPSALLSNQIDATLVIELLKQNQEFKELMMEQSKQNIELQEQLLEAVKDGKIGNTINNNTTNNNKFNLNFFLNETCKDAITMSDFINSIEITMEDFIQTGNIGFVDGISKVMVERIKVMDLHTRPMHCTDLKRETLYIKNDDKWEKEDSDKTLLRRAVKNIANKNYNQLHKWYNNSKPQVEIIGSDDCENYFKYHKAALGGYDKEEDKKFEEKIIKNVLKEVLLDKVPT